MVCISDFSLPRGRALLERISRCTEAKELRQSFPSAGGIFVYMGIRVSKACATHRKRALVLWTSFHVSLDGGSVMADTRFLNALSDQVLIQRFKQFSGIDRDLVLRVLKQRFNRGSLKADLPSSLRQALKDKV